MKTIKTQGRHVLFGQFIREAREQKGLSQIEASEGLGLSQSYYSYLERGERDMDLDLAFDICEFYGIEMNDFIENYLK